jgi:hypothetical protein
MGRLAALAEAEEARDLQAAARAQAAGSAPAESAPAESASAASAVGGSGAEPVAAAAAAEAVVAGLAAPLPLPPGSPPFPLFWRRMLEVRLERREENEQSLFFFCSDDQPGISLSP